MKKNILYSGLLFTTVALASCNGDYDDWAAPQSYAQEDMVTVPGFTATYAGDVDLADVEGDSVTLFTLPATSLPTGYSVGNVTISLTYGSGDEATTTTLNSDTQGRVSKTDLQSLIETAYGKRPTARTFAAQVKADAIKDGGAVYINAGSFDVNATPEAPYISEHYYIVGAPSSWSLDDTSLPFTHSDQNVYDDPEFVVTFPVEDGEYWFAIADDKTDAANNDWSTLLGCAEGNGNNGDEGGIIRRSDASEDLGDCSWKVTVSGDAKYIRMTINMMDYTYKIEKLNFGEYVYLPGDANGWVFDQDCLRGANYDGEYLGFAVLGGEWGWKITPAQNWDSSYGAGSSDGVIALGGGNIMEGSTATLYYCNINLANLTYALTPITSVSIVGNATGDSSWGTDLDLVQSSDNPRVWTYTGHLEAGEFKFRMNYGWDVNLGGASADALENNGTNLSIAAAGDYTVTLTLGANGKSSYTIE